MKTTFKRKLKTTLKYVFTVSTLFVLTVILINSSPFDEKLNPEIKKFLMPRPYPPIEGNAYFAIMGINADKEDMIEAGNKIIKEYLAKKNEVYVSKSKEQIIANYIKKTNWGFNYKLCEINNSIDCLTTDQEEIKHYPIKNNNLRMMLKRYDKIVEMNHYQSFDDLDFMHPVPQTNFFVFIQLEQIRLINLYHSRTQEEFLRQLKLNINFWKMVINNGTLLTDVIPAFNGLKDNILYLSEYMRKEEINPENTAKIQRMLVLLMKEELDLSDVMLWDPSSFLKLLQDKENMNVSLFEEWIFQPNATSNAQYASDTEHSNHIKNLTLNDLISEHKIKQKRNLANVFNLKRLYNYLGKYLVNSSKPSAWTDYLVRPHDVNNMIKMVRIQLQNKITNNINQIVSDPKNANMYNNKPFEYDADSKILKFECLDRHAKCRIKL